MTVRHAAVAVLGLLVVAPWISGGHNHTINTHLPVMIVITFAQVVLMILIAFRLTESSIVARSYVVAIALATTWPLLVAIYRFPGDSILWPVPIVYWVSAVSTFNTVRQRQFLPSAMRAVAVFLAPSLCIGLLAARIAGLLR